MIFGKLESIRSRIIAFALMAALIPSLLISLIAYDQSRRALTETMKQELETASSQVARETDVWLKERLYDLRVFAGSSVVFETLTRRNTSTRLAEYLSSVRARFSDYEEIQLVDAGGRLIASSAKRGNVRKLSDYLDEPFETSRNLVGRPFRDEKTKKAGVVLGVPVKGGDGRLLGVLLASVDFGTLNEALHAFPQWKGRVYLSDAHGELIVKSNNGSVTEKRLVLEPETAKRLQTAEGKIIKHRDMNGVDVLASALPLSQAAWIAVADWPVKDAYGMAIRLRNQAIVVISVLLAIIAVAAYWLGSVVARPLVRLSGAAAQVSAGDLSIGLPEDGRGEVATLTRAFNGMIASLRKSREELERLSTTDTLTGLGNRRYLLGQLEYEIQRSNRSGQPFSILMLDVDHFKKYNDEHGHQAGDEVLVRLSAILQNSVRPYDCTARYGGEEFLIVLSGTPLDLARETAERIRTNVREERVEGRQVTVSIGVAEFPSHGDNADLLIARADAALYEAKRAGRDRVAIGEAGNSGAKAAELDLD